MVETALVAALFLVALSVAGLVWWRHEREQRAALENARALLMRAVNSMSDGFVLFDPDDRIVLCNQVYATTLEGFDTAHSLIGVDVETIIRRQIEKGQPIPPEFEGNVDRWVADRLATHRRADGRPHVQQLSGGGGSSRFGTAHPTAALSCCAPTSPHSRRVNEPPNCWRSTIR